MCIGNKYGVTTCTMRVPFCVCVRESERDKCQFDCYHIWLITLDHIYIIFILCVMSVIIGEIVVKGREHTVLWANLNSLNSPHPRPKCFCAQISISKEPGQPGPSSSEESCKSDPESDTGSKSNAFSAIEKVNKVPRVDGRRKTP